MRVRLAPGSLAPLLQTSALAGLGLAFALQDPVLLADIDNEPTPSAHSDPEFLTELGGNLWLSARTDTWKFDPATGEALQLADSYPLTAPVVAVGGGGGR